MEIGLYSFAENTPDLLNNSHLQSPAERLKDLLEEIELADQLGLVSTAWASTTARTSSPRRR